MKLSIKNLMTKKYSLLALLILNAPAWSVEHEAMDMNSMSAMDHAQHQSHAKPSSQKAQAEAKHLHEEKPKAVVKAPVRNVIEVPIKHQHDMSATTMDHQMGNMQGGAAPADARSSDYSQGRDFGPIHPPMMMGNDPLMTLAVNRLEWMHSRNNSNQAAYEIEGWWGNDWNRAVLKAEGRINNQSLKDARTELLWRKPVSTFWNTDLGVRQDSGYANNRTWLALGINGTAPYWLDLDATLYVRDQNQTALILNAEYDWRITQSWVVQPRLEVSFYGKNDLANDLGQGLSEVQSGLRLRYDINHQFMPYIGVEMKRHYGKTADLITIKGEQSNQTFAVAGVAFWF